MKELNANKNGKNSIFYGSNQIHWGWQFSPKFLRFSQWGFEVKCPSGMRFQSFFLKGVIFMRAGVPAGSVTRGC